MKIVGVIRIFIPKRYGESQVKHCPWCNTIAISHNEQNVPVCSKHKQFIFQNVKCNCGKYLDLRAGKFGIFFSCIDCGIITLKKAVEINKLGEITKEKSNAEKRYTEKKYKLHNNRITTKAKEQDMYDLLASVKANKKDESQIAAEKKKEALLKKVKEEKIPTIYELFND